MNILLSVDLGVKTGLALYTSEPRLIWYRSKNYGNKNRLKADIRNILTNHQNLSYIIIEGGGDLAKLWKNEAMKRNIEVIQIHAAEWRKEVFHQNQMKNGPKAKQSAISLAKKVIMETNGPKPTSMVHDAAEAILIGYWGMKQAGWISGEKMMISE